MDTNARIISDLEKKIGFHKPLDILGNWKGVPVMVAGQIKEVHDEKIVFQLKPPDSICFADKKSALILHDAFIIGIQGQILAFDPKEGIAEFGAFSFVNHGFGNRTTVRVEPDSPIPAELVLSDVSNPAQFTVGETTIPCQVIDISLNGFGILAKPTEDLEDAKGKDIRINIHLLNKDIEIPGSLIGVFPKGDSLRLAVSFAPDAPNHEIVTCYIAQRRAEIRQEIQTAYQQAIG